jgi:hypothetical protein
MKKLLVFSLVLIMTVAFASASSGSTLGVNVDEGVSITIEKPVDYWDAVFITGNFGINDNLRLSVGYITEDAYEAGNSGFSLGARYEFVENFSVALEYYDYDLCYEWAINLRGKKDFSDQLALVGMVAYCDADYYDELYNIFGQVEYGFNDFVTGNLGLEFSFREDDNMSRLVAGIEFYPTENFTLWADYKVDIEESDNDLLGLGVEFSF